MKKELSEICCDLIALSLVPGLGPKKIMTLVEEGRTAGEAEPIRKSREFLEEIEYIAKEGIHPICFADEEYPEALKDIYDPPPILFCKGSLCSADTNAVAIVGSRRCSAYGMRVAEKLAFDLATEGVTVISGMARGIDTAAHRGALDAKGRTIAVMGSGFRNVYPPDSGKLASGITENGAVLTEYLSGTLPTKGNFPRRNRIISGMAKGVVVVEAAARSGAMITVNFALEQGRDVFAVPGRIDTLTSGGTNKLIQDGAKLITNADDILEELNIEKKGRAVSAAERREKNSREILTEEHQEILTAIVEEKSGHIDQIYDRTKIEFRRLSKVLLDLELKGLIKQLPGTKYVAN